MARDIEEFLRRAAERRQKQGGGQPPARPAPPPQRPAPPPSRPPAQQQQPQRQKPNRLVIQDDAAYSQPELKQQQPPRRETLAEHVKNAVDSSDIAEHASHLGEKLSYTDERVDARLKRRFGNDLSQLDDRPTVQDADAPIVVGKESSEVAKEIVELFRSAKSMRQAILISEIMKRPEF